MLINIQNQFELWTDSHLNEAHLFLKAVSLLTRCTLSLSLCCFFFLKTPDLPWIRSASAHVNLHFRHVEEMVSRQVSAVDGGCQSEIRDRRAHNRRKENLQDR